MEVSVHVTSYIRINSLKKKKAFLVVTSNIVHEQQIKMSHEK